MQIKILYQCEWSFFFVKKNMLKKTCLFPFSMITTYFVHFLDKCFFIMPFKCRNNACFYDRLFQDTHKSQTSCIISYI